MNLDLWTWRGKRQKRRINTVGGVLTEAHVRSVIKKVLRPSCVEWTRLYSKIQSDGYEYKRSIVAFGKHPWNLVATTQPDGSVRTLIDDDVEFDAMDDEEE